MTQPGSYSAWWKLTISINSFNSKSLMTISNQNIFQKFVQFFKGRNLLRSNFLVAVSGGIDSVVLCELCKQAGFNFSIAHCNFKLRGEESERDENFVRSIGEKYGSEVFVKNFDTENYAEEKKLSIQEAARELRYQWFLQLKNENGFSFTLVAHHADDNIETLLMNFFRGTGLHGLTAMPVWNLSQTYILRPLMDVRRSEIQQFAEEHQLKWVEDSSNASSKYTRNFFRNEIIPAIKKVYPNVEKNLLDNIERFKKTEALYSNAVSVLKAKLYEHHGNEIRIPILKLMEHQHSSFLYEVIKEFGFGEKQVDELIKLAGAASGKFIENDQHQIIKNRKWFVVVPKFLSGIETVAIDEEEKEVSYGQGLLQLKTGSKEKFSLQKNETVAQLNAQHIEYPLLLRKWKQGDYFYPLGMRKKKKIARFFIDQKLSRNQKENVWVIESNKKILWVVGLRIDERFKVTDSTKEILQISWTSL